MKVDVNMKARLAFAAFLLVENQHDLFRIEPGIGKPDHVKA